MVRCGSLDGQDDPTPQSPVLAICPRCDAKDKRCPYCSGRGTFRIERHPAQLVPAWVWSLCALADLYIEKGLPPIAGGSLDQSSWFVNAAMFIAHDRERILAERYGKT